MAFVHVQSYLHIMGRNATYEETTNIVKKYGFSVEEYNPDSNLDERGPSAPGFSSRVGKRNGYSLKRQKFIEIVRKGPFDISLRLSKRLCVRFLQI